MKFYHRHLWLCLLGTVFAAVVGSFLALNFTPPEKEIASEIVSPYAVDDPGFVREMDALLGAPLVPGNTVATLLNGREIFPAMIGAIRQARQSICLETYIYWSGKTGREFTDALEERARAGVPVHVLVDWIGSQRLHRKAVDRLRAAGVEFEEYHPLRWYDLARFNNRTHRRILVVDGRIGFTGGAGIGDEWRGDARSTEEWRDTHFRVEGPVVAAMEGAFMDNWIKTRSVLLQGPRYFPELTPREGVSAQFFDSSPTSGSGNVRMMYLLAIAAARKSITISASYFVPDSLFIQTLVSARRRGVDVALLLPGSQVDAGLVRRASRGEWGPLLEAGIRFYEYQPTMFHCKTMTVDGRWVTVGSTNFDNRSFRLNDESNLNVYDAAFAARQTAIFEDDLKSARPVSLDAWRRRPLLDKALERFLGLFAGEM